MCKILEEMKDEVRQETIKATQEQDRLQFANFLIEDGGMSLEKIAKATKLTIERVRDLAAQKAVPNS